MPSIPYHGLDEINATCGSNVLLTLAHRSRSVFLAPPAPALSPASIPRTSDQTEPPLLIQTTPPSISLHNIGRNTEIAYVTSDASASIPTALQLEALALSSRAANSTENALLEHNRIAEKRDPTNKNKKQSKNKAQRE